MSYLQLNIGGKLRGLKYNQGAYVTFYQHVDTSDYLATVYYAVVYAGLKSNSFVKREEFTETFEQICDLVDEMPQEDKDAALKVFSETTHWQKLVEENKEPEVKETPEEKKSEPLST